MEFSFSQRILDLVTSGVITIGIHITQDGNDIWARAVQPHPRLGITTQTSYVPEDLADLLSKITTTRPTKMAFGSEPSYPVDNSVKGPGRVHFDSIDKAILYSKKNQLTKHFNGGVWNLLPEDSIVPLDMDRSNLACYARFCAVADKLGTAKLVSRISTNRQNLYVRGSTDLQEWWTNATPLQRVILLGKKKHFSRDESGEIRIHGRWLDLIQELPHPFREAGTQVDQHEEEYSSEESTFSPAWRKGLSSNRSSFEQEDNA
jgi:hypothetical protein